MKTKIFSVWLLAFCLTGCGAATPLQRGQPLRMSSPAMNSKPETAGPIEPGAPNPPAVAEGLDRSFFQNNLLPVLEKKCSLCHDSPVPDFESASRMVEYQNLEKSELYLWAAAKKNGHRVIFKPESVELALLVNWINGAHAR